MTFVAIAHPLVYRPQKRDALLFDHIELLRLDENLGDLPTVVATEIEWLQQRGVVVEGAVNPVSQLKNLSSADVKYHYLSSLAHAMAASIVKLSIEEHLSIDAIDWNELRSSITATAVKWNIDSEELTKASRQVLDAAVKRVSHKDLPAVETLLNIKTFNDMARFTALCKAAGGVVDAVPILASVVDTNEVSRERNLLTVINVVLKSLSLPDASTPREAIIDFRQDTDAMQSLRRLRVWMRRIAAQNVTETQLADELEAMIEDHNVHLRRHRIQASGGRLEAVLTLAAEIVDDVIHVRVASAVKALFAVRKSRLDLYEAERASPGREIAYIARVRDRFGQSTA